MKKVILLFFAFSMSCSFAFAQPFYASEIARFEGIEQINVKWADMNNDGKLDVLGFKLEDGQIDIFILIQKDTTDFQYLELLLDSPSGLDFQLKDINHDGFIDIVYPKSEEQGSLVVALNRKGLNFDIQEIDIRAETFIIYDVDFDGDEDFIVCSTNDNKDSFVTWIKQDTSFLEMNKIMNISLVSASYYLSNEHVMAFVHHEEGNLNDELVKFSFDDDSIKMDSFADFPRINSVATGDLNQDGIIDFIINASENDTTKVNYIYYQNLSGFEVDSTTLANLKSANFCLADIDLDGLADILSIGQGEQDSVIFHKNEGSQLFSGDSSFFAINVGFINLPADIDDDGDLDLLSLTNANDTIIIYTQINQTTIQNKGPGPVYIRPPLTIYDQTFFSWQKTNDDHTDSASISYELFLQNEATGTYHTMLGYDMDTTNRVGFRKVVGNGYQWFDNTYTANHLENGKYFWGVVGVDNAFYASSDIRKSNGPCHNYYVPVNCFDLIVADTTVCFNSDITLSLGEENDLVSWFSVKKGFLSKSPELTFKALEPDTIYAYYFPKIPCDEETDLCVLNYSLAVDIEKRDEEILVPYTVCNDSSNVISVSGEWDSVNWWNNNKLVASGNEIILDSIPEFPLVAEAFDSLICPVYDTLELKSKEKIFDPGVLPNSIAACKGQPTQIDIFSSINIEALDFFWSPPEVFDDPNIPNPEITVNDLDKIELVVVEDNCFIDSIDFVLEINELPIVTTNGDQEIFRGEKVRLEADGAETYSWSPDIGLDAPNSKNTWAAPVSTTKYKVRGTDGNSCSVESSLLVLVKRSVFVPDLFTPNGDGNNDYLRVYGEGIKEISFLIYDEKGAKIYELNANALNSGWDGNYQGRELPGGTYFWTVSGQFIDGQSVSYQGKNKGSVRLLR